MYSVKHTVHNHTIYSIHYNICTVYSKKYWKTYYFVTNHFFEDKTVRRRFWDQLRPTKAPRGAKMTPKRDPRSSPKRPQIDIKIVIDFDAKTKRARQGSTRRNWAETPPPGRRPRGSGRGPKRHGTGPQAHMCALKEH